MPISEGELVARIDAHVASIPRAAREGVMTLRRVSVLARMREMLMTRGFPESDEERYAVCVIPDIFQEANWDGIGWGVGTSDYAHLQTEFDLDFLVANAGRSRAEVSTADEQRYWARVHEFIEWRTQRKR